MHALFTLADVMQSLTYCVSDEKLTSTVAYVVTVDQQETRHALCITLLAKITDCLGLVCGANTCRQRLTGTGCWGCC
jgi:hypothetical protein